MRRLTTRSASDDEDQKKKKAEAGGEIEKSIFFAEIEKSIFESDFRRKNNQTHSPTLKSISRPLNTSRFRSYPQKKSKK